MSHAVKVQFNDSQMHVASDTSQPKHIIVKLSCRFQAKS